MRPLGFGHSSNNNNNNNNNTNLPAVPNSNNSNNNNSSSDPRLGYRPNLFSHFTGGHNNNRNNNSNTNNNNSAINHGRFYNNDEDDMAMDDMMSDDDSDVDMNNNAIDDSLRTSATAGTASIADVLSSSNASINRTLASLGASNTNMDASGVLSSSSSQRPATFSSAMPSTQETPAAASTSSNAADPESEKRKEIQKILRDKSLTNVEKNIRIQQLMDGRKKKDLGSVAGNNISMSRLGKPTAVARTSFSTLSLNDNIAESIQHINCVHYERKCVIVSPCCGKVFGCRVCHDEAVPPPCPRALDRFKIRQIICKECKTIQSSKTNKCTNCNVQLAEYHCAKCNIWMSNAKRPFHCDECGFCRVGGRETFKHCKICCMCISVTVYDTHNCMRDKYKNNCPVCTEDMFSSRQSPQDLPCGHAIHAHCFRKLAGFDYRCPVCKKTVVSRASMAAAWNARARDIAMQPMPPDLARTVNITCNDCERKSDNCNFHFLGVQCPHCGSFNTQQLGGGDEGTAATSGGNNEASAGAAPAS